MQIKSLLCFLTQLTWQLSSTLARDSAGILLTTDAPIGISVASPSEVAHLPAQFDAREHWPECARSLRSVSFQGSCGACWAIVAAEVMSDRFCIASRGQVPVQLSPWHLLQCCGLGACADGKQDFGGCAGGDPYPTLRYIAEHGIVTRQCKPTPEWLAEYGVSTFADDEVKCDRVCQDPAIEYEVSFGMLSNG